VANQVAARLAGDDYQHLFAWREALDLLAPLRRVAQVRVEDALALSFDDVTVTHEPMAGEPDLFYQIKYHVDRRNAYSMDSFMEHLPGGTSLLQKFYRSYLNLSGTGSRTVVLTFVSNWTWDHRDALSRYISGHAGEIKEDFLTASERSKPGRNRSAWIDHLRADSDQFASFIRSLRLRVGYSCWEEVNDGVADRMASRGLRSDDAAIATAMGAVREWIKRGPRVLDRAAFEEEIARYNLKAPGGGQEAVTIVLNTIASPKLEVAPDFTLDWCSLFDGEDGRRRQLIDPRLWNQRLLPELRDLEQRVKQSSTARLVRARGAARLSPWTAFGYTFGDVAGYTLEFDQRGSPWRTDASPATSFELNELDLKPLGGSRFDGPGECVAVAISVSDHIHRDVIKHLQSSGAASQLRVFAPKDGPSPTVLSSAGDAVALSYQVKQQLREVVRDSGARRLLLFLCCPASAACFIGHRLNAVGAELVLMEDQQPGYAANIHA
jgi:hypothetical protein